MRVESIEAFDKEGRKVILRSACEDDAEDLIKYLKETAKETLYLLREEDEINLTVEDEKGLIKMFLELACRACAAGLLLVQWKSTRPCSMLSAM